MPPSKYGFLIRPFPTPALFSNSKSAPRYWALLRNRLACIHTFSMYNPATSRRAWGFSPRIRSLMLSLLQSVSREGPRSTSVAHILIPRTPLFRKFNSKLLCTAALTAVLVVLVGSAVGQTTDTISGKQSPDSASATPSATPAISGPLRFLSVVNHDTGVSASSIPPAPAIGDVNGDGNLDLVLVNDDPTTVSLVLGNGDGSFGAPRSISTGLSAVERVTLADLNADGKLDLVVTGCGATCAQGAIAVLLGNGDGTFKAGVLYSSGGSSPAQIAVADLNADAKPDLVVVNDCPTSSCTLEGTVGVLLSKGNGTFEPAVSYSSGGYAAFAVTIADVNGDGKPDVLVANQCSPNGCTTYDQGHQVGVLLGRGDGTFKSAVGYASGGFRANSIVAVDLNGEGKLDLVVGNSCAMQNCGDQFESSVGVLLGNGDGTFNPATAYDVGGTIENGMTLVDINGDGKLDLVIPAFCNESTVGCGSALANLFALVGNGDGTFQASKILFMVGTYGGPTSLSIADLNNDGKPDLLVTHGCNYLDCPAENIQAGVMFNNSGAPATTTSITSSKNPVPLYTSVTYTAKVAGSSDGTVTFADGDDPLATVSLSGNEVTYSTTYKTAGTHTVTATYSGELHTAEASRSVGLLETVVDPTKTVLTTSGSPTFVGQSVTFTATVTSNFGAIPNGELMKFYDGSTLLASVGLSSGKATFTTSTLTAKSHGMKAVYVGDSMFATSTGYATQVVQLYPTTTTLTCSPNPSAFGEAVTIKATVKSSGPYAPTGSVTFRDGSTWIGSGTISGAVVTITRSNLAVGSHSITATYNGDSKSASSKSSIVTQVVN